MSDTPELLTLDRTNTPCPYDWLNFVEAIKRGHQRPKAVLKDVFLGPANKTLLSRAALIEGLGYGVKSVTVMAENSKRNLPTVQGGMLVFDPDTGAMRGLIDSGLVTDLKTASDSVLGAMLLARPDAKHHLIIGAGAVAHNIAVAYQTCLPHLSEVTIWNRNRTNAEALVEQLASEGITARVADDLPSAAAQADIISTATMATEPVLLGEWVQPGTHVDLIGAFKADMREADDTLLQKARLFVDSFDTTISHIGEIAIPLASGAISRDDIQADFYDLIAGHTGRENAKEITVFKNGGGAHLDLMIADTLLQMHAG
ncbi:ornithine cyclodeaminase family protein [Celeribacter sp.]|uniref:ornithine cyclodeaminase family protein n=1 Tax=Celeribacter sp. TaxID=1890673 RepID=UPI003A8E7539